MERINIIVSSASRYGPHDLALVGLSRTERDDGEMSVDGYGFTSGRWEWGRTIWYAWWHHNHAESWGYVYDFSNGRQGVSRVRDVIPALAAVGARFDPAGPPDPPPPVTSDPSLERLLDEEEEIARGTGFREAALSNIRRPVADSLPTITPYHVRNPGGINYYMVASGNSYTTIRTADGYIRAVRLDEEGAPY